jgi:hypothetical protein
MGLGMLSSTAALTRRMKMLWVNRVQAAKAARRNLTCLVVRDVQGRVVHAYALELELERVERVLPDAGVPMFLPLRLRM